MRALVILKLLLAIFNAFPSIEKLVKCAVILSQKAKVTKALSRKNEKDKAVDNAIDGNYDS